VEKQWRALSDNLGPSKIVLVREPRIGPLALDGRGSFKESVIETQSAARERRAPGVRELRARAFRFHSSTARGGQLSSHCARHSPPLTARADARTIPHNPREENRC
jgi:hypothetical protein